MAKQPNEHILLMQEILAHEGFGKLPAVHQEIYKLADTMLKVMYYNENVVMDVQSALSLAADTMIPKPVVINT